MEKKHGGVGGEAAWISPAPLATRIAHQFGQEHRMGRQWATKTGNWSRLEYPGIFIAAQKDT
jgi:hypothetical protein